MVMRGVAADIIGIVEAENRIVPFRAGTTGARGS
jgi:hypothetical protein